MSWHISVIGKSENIVTALEEMSSKLEGPSKTEFDAALPHLVGLVKQNFNSEDSPVMRLTASGHGYDNYRSCTCTLESTGSVLV